MEIRWNKQRVETICDKIHESNIVNDNELAYIERALYLQLFSDTIISQSLGITPNDLCLKYQNFSKRNK